ncbi:hypothetical protein ACIBCT_39760 [Streptosporangium sp. NPDC050855]|uniref:hypothetical protein n=1 Tax=Streptosporangium sp. NPDC050855 TaxID=3366194 RepID=UPI00379405FB
MVIAIGLVVQMTTSPAQASATDHIRKCGIVTCSDYYSHDWTVKLDNAVQKGDFGPLREAAQWCRLGLAGAAVLAAVSLPASGVVGVPCGFLALLDYGVSRFTDILHHAATSNACLRIRFPKGASFFKYGWYADRSSNCRSMD